MLLIIYQMTSGACSRYRKVFFFKEKESMLVLRYVIFKMTTIISELKSLFSLFFQKQIQTLLILLEIYSPYSRCLSINST